MMKPLSLSTLLFLAQSGWEMDTLMLMCVQRFNNLSNTPIDHRPWQNDERHANFRRAAFIMRNMQEDDHLTTAIMGDNPDAHGVLIKRGNDSRKPESESQSQLEYEFEELTGIEHGAESIRLSPSVRPWGKNEIAFQMRSPLAIMTALARVRAAYAPSVGGPGDPGVRLRG